LRAGARQAPHPAFGHLLPASGAKVEARSSLGLRLPQALLRAGEGRGRSGPPQKTDVRSVRRTLTTTTTC